MTNPATAEITGVAPETASPPRGLDPYLLLAPAAALALFAAGNQNFGFDPPGWLDAFMYLGYFWHYPEHPAVLENYYKASRLPWVLPGYVLHQLFDVVAASYVLHWLTLSGSGIALYLLIRDTLHDRVVAGVASVAWVAATPGHGVGGWNYHIAAASGYYLAACWATARAASQGGSNTQAGIAGALLACAIHTHLFFATFVPLVAGLYVACGWGHPWRAQRRRYVSDASSAAGGGIALTVLLALVNFATGGRWLFFMPQIEYTQWLSALPSNPWWFETSSWLPGARYLVIPLVATGAGTLAMARRRGRNRMRLLFVLQSWAALTIFSYYQFVERQSVLDHDYMAFGLYAHAFPALAAAVSSVSAASRSPRRAAVAVWSASAVMIGVLLAGAPSVAVPGGWISGLLSGVPELAAVLMVAFAGLAAVLLAPGRLTVVFFAAWFGIVNLWVSPARGAYGIGTPGVHRDMLEIFREIDAVAWPLDSSLAGIKYWFASEIVETPQGPVDLADVFDSYTSTRGWPGALLAGASPGVPIGQIQVDHLAGVSCLAALTSIVEQHRIDRALRQQFITLERPLRPIGWYQFERPGLPIGLTIYSVSPADSAPLGRAHGSCLP